MKKNKLSFEEFKKLIEVWRDETGYMSTTHGIAKHPSCAKILSYDNKEDITGYACLVIDSNLHQALILLDKLVPEEKQPPIDAYYAGFMSVIRECWKCWAYTEKILYRKGGMSGYWDEDNYGNNNKTPLQLLMKENETNED